MVVLGALLVYLWALAGRLASGVGGPLRRGTGDALVEPGACLELVQDNAADGVALRDGNRIGLRGRVPLGEEATLGRYEENALIIGDRFTSGRHARVFRRAGRYWLEDLGSKNGTLLNGHRLSSAQALEAGDRITVGSCTFRFVG
jgi:pSer/pThr/pTyr-binding forkhead associated (FHA) protein